MNEARQDAFGAAVNGKIYVAGGKTCEVYNPSTNEQHLTAIALQVWCAFKDHCLFLRAQKMMNRGSYQWKCLILTQIHGIKTTSNTPIGHESAEESKKGLYPYRTCFAKIHRDVLCDLK